MRMIKSSSKRKLNWTNILTRKSGLNKGEFNPYSQCTRIINENCISFSHSHQLG